MQIKQLIAISHPRNPNAYFHLYEITTYYSKFWLATEVIIAREKDEIKTIETVLAYFDNQEKAIQYIQLKRKYGYLKPKQVEVLPYGWLEQDSFS